MSLITKLFKRKRSLRDVCVELYGEDFGKQYDTLASGGTIGAFDTTMEFLEKVELARMVSDDAGKKLKQNKGAADEQSNIES